MAVGKPQKSGPTPQDHLALLQERIKNDGFLYVSEANTEDSDLQGEGFGSCGTGVGW